MSWYVFSPIDKLYASKMSVNFVTIESISDWLTFVFKLNGWLVHIQFFPKKGLSLHF